MQAADGAYHWVEVHAGPVERIGQATLNVWRILKAHTGFVGSVALELFALAREPQPALRLRS